MQASHIHKVAFGQMQEYPAEVWGRSLMKALLSSLTQRSAGLRDFSVAECSGYLQDTDEDSDTSGTAARSERQMHLDRRMCRLWSRALSIMHSLEKLYLSLTLHWEEGYWRLFSGILVTPPHPIPTPTPHPITTPTPLPSHPPSLSNL